MATKSKLHPACERDGHDYQPVEEADTRLHVKGGTDILRTFICRKCGDDILKKIAFWPQRQKEGGE